MDNVYSQKVSGRLLISGSPLIVMPLLAEKIGLNEAIIIQQIHYWISNPLNENIKDGRVWVYNTYEQWIKQFPFWSRSTIKLTILSLQNKRLLITGSFNKKRSDRTKWYTIDYDSFECLDIGTWDRFKPTMGLNRSHGRLKSVPCTITETTTKISTDIKKNNKKSFDTEFEEFWEAYSKKVSRHKCFDIYNKILKIEGIKLHQSIIQSISGQNKEREVNEALGIWQPLKKHPSTWLNGRCWEDSFKTDGEIHEEHRRSVDKLSRQPGRMSKTEQYHDINAKVREAAERRVEAIEREREALEREIRNCEGSD